MDRYQITIKQPNPPKLIYKGIENANNEEHAMQIAERIKEYYRGKYVEESKWIATVEKQQIRF